MLVFEALRDCPTVHIGHLGYEETQRYIPNWDDWHNKLRYDWPEWARERA